MKSDRAEFAILVLYKLGVTDFSIEISMPSYFTDEQVNAVAARLAECGLQAKDDGYGILEILEA